MLHDTPSKISVFLLAARYLNKCVLFIFIIFFFVSQNVYAKNNQPPTDVEKFNGTSISVDAKDLLAQKKWDAASFEKGLYLIGNKSESSDSRRAVLEKFRSEGKKLDSKSLKRLFNQTILISKDPTETSELSISAIRTISNVALLLRDKEGLTKTEIKHDVLFLVEIAQDKNRDVVLRGTAIRAAGILGVDEAKALLRELLADPSENARPEIAQNALLAIYRLDGKGAISSIGDVLSHTQNPAIYGTAAFSLGQIKTSESMVKLVQNENRFPNSAFPDAVLVDMEDVILSILNKPQDENLSYAIQATRHLWREGQKERYIPKLRNLLTSASLLSKKEALKRLMEEAGKLSFNDEKRFLQDILPLISNQSELNEYTERIQRRMSAVILTPISTISTPKNLKANRR